MQCQLLRLHCFHLGRSSTLNESYRHQENLPAIWKCISFTKDVIPVKFRGTITAVIGSGVGFAGDVATAWRSRRGVGLDVLGKGFFGCHFLDEG